MNYNDCDDDDWGFGGARTSMAMAHLRVHKNLLLLLLIPCFLPTIYHQGGYRRERISYRGKESSEIKTDGAEELQQKKRLKKDVLVAWDSAFWFPSL